MNHRTRDRPRVTDEVAVSRLMELTGRQLLDEFAAPTPAPGGGAAAALAGALGTSLLVMVASLSRTKHGSPEDATMLAEATTVLTPLRTRLSELVDEDTAAYDAVVQAYRLPKAVEEERRVRRDAVQAALQRATDVPLEVMRACEEAMRQAVVVAERGNPAASSDCGVALELLRAAFAGALLNVRANLGSISDAAYAAQTSTAVDRLEGSCQRAMGRSRHALATP